MREYPVLRFYHMLYFPLREVAREHGYALATHGSLARDIDLIAVPWREDVSAPDVLVTAVRERIREIVGCAGELPEYPNPGIKPQGRMAWTYYLQQTESGDPFGVYVDLSVVAPRENISQSTEK